MNDAADPRVILATDCGSTTTKAILIERDDSGWRLRVRGEAPTTVEAPFDDVMVGVRNAVREIEELSGRRLLDAAGELLRPARAGAGTDLYLSTSSAGGGLQMTVAGVVASMTAESAARAALGAGAIVMDTIATNDGRQPHERVERIRRLRPDMILLSGGVDGGTVTHVAELAETIAAADPRPRLGETYRLPVVFAGNVEARGVVRETLSGKVALTEVDNVRPILEQENLGPAREAIHDLFMEHVMAQAPGYGRLKAVTDHAIVPTPGAVGDLIDAVARRDHIQVLGVDIGGATTDVFSVFQGIFNRTVSANLGMSYSVSNVLASAGLENVLRWLPIDLPPGEVRNRIKNKMIRPTTIPATVEDLVLEQALAREALRLAFEQHRSFATTLKGVQHERTIAEAFAETGSGESLVDPLGLELLVGSGGVLSHAPRRVQAAWMMLDAFQPEGVTRLAVDSIFMMPQLGVLARIRPDAAYEVFHRDCLVPLGTAIAPRGRHRVGRPALHLEGDGIAATTLSWGELRRVPLEQDRSIEVQLRPERGVDVGAGAGRPLTARLSGGKVGLLLDGRGRPVVLPMDAATRRATLAQWAAQLDAWPPL